MWRMIYVPSRRLVCASLSLGEIAPPTGFNFPTMSDYAGGLVSGIQYVGSLSSGDRGGLFTPPAVSSGVAFKGMMESAVGTTINGIASGIASGDGNVVSVVSSLATNLLMGGVEVAVSQAGVAAGSAVGSALSGIAGAIPVLGQIVSLIVQYLGEFFAGESEEQQAREELRRQQGFDQQINSCLRTTCDRLIGQCSGRASMVTDVGLVMSPADSFRNISYALNGYIPLPVACPSSMYVILCGAEDPGGLINRDRYNAIVNQVRKSTGDPKIGLPQHVQRTMSKLIAGICQAVTSPEAGYTGEPIKDQGRSLYPLLIDIVYKHWKPYVIKNNVQVEGYWDENLLYAFVDEMLGTCKAYGGSVTITTSPSGDMASGGQYDGTVTKQKSILSSCNFIGSLYKATGFMKLIGDYESNLRWQFGLQGGGLSPVPVNSETKSRLLFTKKNSKLVMTPQRAAEVMSNMRSDGSDITRLFLTGAGMLGTGYLAWQGGKRLALASGTHRRLR
jgi:hypothetical protein